MGVVLLQLMAIGVELVERAETYLEDFYPSLSTRCKAALLSV